MFINSPDWIWLQFYAETGNSFSELNGSLFARINALEEQLHRRFYNFKKKVVTTLPK